MNLRASARADRSSHIDPTTVINSLLHFEEPASSIVLSYSAQMKVSTRLLRRDNGRSVLLLSRIRKQVSFSIAAVLRCSTNHRSHPQRKISSSSALILLEGAKTGLGEVQSASLFDYTQVSSSRVVGLARIHLIVIVNQDMPWAAPSTLELVQMLVKQGPTPQLPLLRTARPDSRRCGHQR
jgi:hypothetical protein